MTKAYIANELKTAGYLSGNRLLGKVGDAELFETIREAETAIERYLNHNNGEPLFRIIEVYKK